MVKQDLVKISIPKELIAKLEKRSSEMGFGSVSSYITYILKQVLNRLDKPKSEQGSNNKDEIVKKRLKDLGYLR